MPTRARSTLARTTLTMVTLAAAIVASTAHAQSRPVTASDSAFDAKVAGIHARVMTLDTHVDISPANFRADTANYATRLPKTQVDLAKMKQGGLDAVFLAVYVGQPANGAGQDAAGYARAHGQAMDKFAAIHRLVETIAPDKAGLALTPADAARIYASGRAVIFAGIENGYPIGTDITNVRRFYDLGGRYMSLAHNNHSQLSDSHTGEKDGVWQWHGLSPLGKQVVEEMNRVGMMIDVSHPSKESMMQTIALTKAPIIASHSGVRALCNHSRNMDDEQLRALKANGGVIQVVAFTSYLKCAPAAGTGPATVQDLVNHIDYAVKLIGVDHVGIASDFDGGGGIDGWHDATETINVTRELVKRGYSEGDIAKIWSGNLLRVMQQVQDVAKKLQASPNR